MATVLNTSGSTLQLFLLATGVLLLALNNVNADGVTIEQCKSTNHVRVLRDSWDDSATDLYLTSCGLRLIDDQFGGLPNLHSITYIDLQNNSIVQLNTTALRAVPKLNKLLLFFNKLSEAPVFVEQTCPKLTELAIQHNKITAIYNPDTFSACRNLKLITLSDNMLRYIHPQSFSKLTELESLYLGNNKLDHIPEEMLAKNHKLKELSLADNKLTRLPPDFVVNLKRTAAGLNQLYLFVNPWHCTCLVELLSDIKRAGVPVFKTSVYTDIEHYDGSRPECVYFGMYPCHPHYKPQAPSRDQSAITYSYVPSFQQYRKNNRVGNYQRFG